MSGATAAITEPAQKTATPVEHHLLATEKVADGAETEHQAGERQGIAVHHPLQLADRGVQLALHVGEDNGDDGVVEKGQEKHEQERRQSRRVRLADAIRAGHAFHAVNVDDAAVGYTRAPVV